MFTAAQFTLYKVQCSHLHKKIENLGFFPDGSKHPLSLGNHIMLSFPLSLKKYNFSQLIKLEKRLFFIPHQDWFR